MGRNTIHTAIASTLIFLWSFIGTAEAFQSVVKRTTLLVSDIERSVEFYKAIGFDIWLDRGGDRDPDSPSSLPLNGRPGHSHITIMSGQHPDWAMIGLLEFSNPPLAWTREKDDLTIGTSDAVLVIVSGAPRAHISHEWRQSTSCYPPCWRTQQGNHKGLIPLNSFSVRLLGLRSSVLSIHREVAVYHRQDKTVVAHHQSSRSSLELFKTT